MRPRPPPDVQITLPSSFIRASLTRRVLSPVIVLGTVVVLGIVGLLCVVLGIVVLSEGERVGSVRAASGFGDLAGIFSIVYVILHAVAARTNDAVGTTRPPELQLHGACFVVARLGMITWFGSFVAGCVVLSNVEICGIDVVVCGTRVLGFVSATLGLIATGIVLTALETCRYPFEVPNFLHLQKRLKYRVGAFAEDLLDISVSRSPSYRGEREKEKRKGKADENNISKKPLPKPPSEVSDISSAQPVSPGKAARPKRTDPRASKGWGEEWTHLVREMKESVPEKTNTKNSSDSAISLTYDSSSGYVSSSERSSHTRMSSYASTYRRSGMIEGSTYIAGSRRTGMESNAYVFGQRRAPITRRARPRVIIPSSSFSNISRRSPLSTMRYAESPERVVRPDMRSYPPRMRTQTNWILSRSISLSTLVPIADVPQIRRTSAIFPGEMEIQGPNKTLPPLPRPESSVSPSRTAMKRRTADIRIPGAFPRSDSFNVEQNLDDHMRMIEVELVTRRKSKATYSDSVANREALAPLSNKLIRRTSQLERRQLFSRSKFDLREGQSTTSISNESQIGQHDSKVSRYRQRFMPSSRVETPSRSPQILDSRRKENTAHQAPTKSTNVRPVTAKPVSKVEPHLKEFRRLSLGDISSGFEGLLSEDS